VTEDVANASQRVSAYQAPLFRRKRIGPTEMVFVRDIWRICHDDVPNMLRAAGHIVHLQRDIHKTGALDVDWLPGVGAAKWILITKDQNIRKRPIELRAVLNSKVRAFVLTAGEMTGADQAAVFQKALPRMLRILSKTKAPFMANVTESSRVELLHLPRDV